MTLEADVHAWLAGRSERVIETSCARIYLAGDLALKIKKPVDMGFLDFTTAEKRLWALRRELDFNRAYAADLYRGLRAVTRAGDGFALDGRGETVDWALEMRRFADDAVLSDHPDRLNGDLAEALGRAIARAHITAPVTPDGGGFKAMAYTLSTNAQQLKSLADRLGAEAVSRLIEGSDRALAAHADLLEARRAQGLARRCHGDLHLGNILIEDGRPRLFDCIEFNDALSNIDTLYDVAFLLMDLDVRGRREAANRALNGYLDEAARGLPASLWQGLAALPLMLATRAAVRAHVSAHSGDDTAGRAYVEAARRLLPAPKPVLYAIGGLSGSGKTTLARAIAPKLPGSPGAVVLRSDEIRKRLWGVGPLERLPAGAYAAAFSERVHREMFDLAAGLLSAGRAVVLDATFLERERRAEAAQIAQRADAPFHGLWLATDASRLSARLAGRHGDASDADESVLRAQLRLDTGVIDWPRLDAAEGTPTLLARIDLGAEEREDRCMD